MVVLLTCFWGCKVFEFSPLVFVSQLGYLLAIPRSAEMKEERDFAIDGLEFVVIISSLLKFLSSCWYSYLLLSIKNNEKLTSSSQRFSPSFLAITGFTTRVLAPEVC